MESESQCPDCGSTSFVTQGGGPSGGVQYEDGGGGFRIPGWLIFVLIFVVGNLILYATTGIFLIPIPRR